MILLLLAILPASALHLHISSRFPTRQHCLFFVAIRIRIFRLLYIILASNIAFVTYNMRLHYHDYFPFGGLLPLPPPDGLPVLLGQFELLIDITLLLI